MKLYCIKVYELDRFTPRSETYWSYSKTTANLFLERFITTTNPKYYTLDISKYISKYSIEYFETEDDQLIALLTSNPEKKINIWSNHSGTRSIVITNRQYLDSVNSSSITKSKEQLIMEQIHWSCVRLAMIMLRYSKTTDFLDYIYRLAKHNFSDIEIDSVEYMLTKSYMKKYEV